MGRITPKRVKIFIIITVVVSIMALGASYLRDEYQRNVNSKINTAMSNYIESNIIRIQGYTWYDAYIEDQTYYLGGYYIHNKDDLLNPKFMSRLYFTYSGNYDKQDKFYDFEIEAKVLMATELDNRVREGDVYGLSRELNYLNPEAEIEVLRYPDRVGLRGVADYNLAVLAWKIYDHELPPQTVKLLRTKQDEESGLSEALVSLAIVISYPLLPFAMIAFGMLYLDRNFGIGLLVYFLISSVVSYLYARRKMSNFARRFVILYTVFLALYGVFVAIFYWGISQFR